MFDSWRTEWQPTPVFLPGEIHGQSLVGYSPWDPKELDATELLSLTLMEQSPCDRLVLTSFGAKADWGGGGEGLHFSPAISAHN